MDINLITFLICKLIFVTCNILENFHQKLPLFLLYMLKTDQMAEWYGASASGSVDLGFDSKSGQINDLKIGIHSFPV